MPAGRMMKSNLILAAVLVVLSSFALWYEFKQKPKDEHKLEVSKRMLAILEEKEIESIRIVSATAGSDVTLTCTANCKASNFASEWSITAPGAYKADQVVGSGLANVLGTTVPTERVDVSGPEDAVLKNYNLHGEHRGDRRFEIRLKGEKDPVVVYVGDRSPISSDIYVYAAGPGLDGKVAFLASANLEEHVGKKLSHWRSKRIIEVATPEIRGLKFTGIKGDVTITRGTGEESNSWLIAGKGVADPETVDAFITGLTTMSAQDWTSEDLATDRSRLDFPAAPQYKLEIVLDGKPSVVVQAFENRRKPAEHYVATSAMKSVAKVDLLTFQKFQKDREYFRFRKLLSPAEKFNVQKLRLTLGSSAPVTITQDKGLWASSDLTGLLATKVDAAVTAFGAAKIKTYVKPSDVRGERKAIYELFGKDGKPIRSAQFFTRKEKNATQWFARVSGGDAVELEPSTISGLPMKKEDFTTPPAAPAVPHKVPPATLPMPSVAH